MDNKVGILCILHKPFIGISVGAEDKLQAVPFQRVAYRSVNGVDRGKAAYNNPVFLVYDLVLAFVVEFRNVRCKATDIRLTNTSFEIPEIHLFHRFDGGLCTKFRASAAGSPDPQRSKSSRDSTGDI